MRKWGEGLLLSKPEVLWFHTVGVLGDRASLRIAWRRADSPLWGCTQCGNLPLPKHKGFSSVLIWPLLYISDLSCHTHTWTSRVQQLSSDHFVPFHPSPLFELVSCSAGFLCILHWEVWHLLNPYFPFPSSPHSKHYGNDSQTYMPDLTLLSCQSPLFPTPSKLAHFTTTRNITPEPLIWSNFYLQPLGFFIHHG